MQKNLQAFVDAIARPRYYIPLLITFIVLFVWMEVPALPYSAADSRAGMNGIPSLDMRIGYSPDQAYQAISDYGADGRSYYVQKLLINDIAFPVVYSLLFAGTLALLLKRLTRQGSRLRYLALLPLAGGACDLLENAGILTMLLTFPARADWIAVTTGTLTAVKLAVNVTVMMLIAAGLAVVAYRMLRNCATRAKVRG